MYWFPVLIGFGFACLCRHTELPSSIWVHKLVRSNVPTFFQKLRDDSQQWRLGASRPEHYCPPSVNVPDVLEEREHCEVIIKKNKKKRLMFSNPTPSELRLSPAAMRSNDMLSALTPPLHCVCILQLATRP